MVFFNTYSDTVQKILIDSSETFMRFLMLFSIFIFCFVYLLYWKKNNEQKTKSWTLGFLRLLITSFAYIYLAITPFTLILFDPGISFSDLFVFYFGVYGLFMILVVVILIAEIVFIGPLIMLNLMGMDLKDERVTKFIKKIKTGDMR